MRIGYAMAVAAMLAAAPALADVTITSGDNDAARHEYRPDNDAARYGYRADNDAARHDYRLDQDRATRHQNMERSRAEADRGTYGDAMRDRQDAREDWHAARHHDHDADRDRDGGVRIDMGR